MEYILWSNKMMRKKSESEFARKETNIKIIRRVTCSV